MCNKDLNKTEEALLCNFEDNIDISAESTYIKQLWKGNWQVLLTNDILNKLVKECDNEEAIKNELKNIEKEKLEEVFCIGIASLLAFVQLNFTGPELGNLTEDITNKNNRVRQYLASDGEEIDINAKNPILLFISKCIFENCTLNNPNILTWWYMRYIIIHQRILDELSETLYSKIKDKLINLSNWDINNRLKAKLHLEISQLQLIYGQINETEKNINSAKELLGIEFELSGELGKRTKFQQKDIPQIILRVSLADNFERPIFETSNIPNIVELDDEVRLDKIEYSNKSKVPVLPITEQLTILCTVQCMQRSKPKDELLLEESEAFLSYLLQQNNTWTLRFNSLLLRCVLESKHKRTIERSLSQCEALTTKITEDLPIIIDRLSGFWSSGMEPKWKTEAHLANLTLNLGLVKAALDLFLRLQMWEEVIVCYTISNLRHKAAEIIQAQLEINPTVKLWCLLGDATDDESCYEKAWALSNQKSSRVQRHWGQFLFAKKKYAECIPFLEKSLEINSLQNIVWLRLGYAALETENWKLAAHCYRRYTYLEPGGFEAWNNLAKAYIKLGEKTRAHFALQEALKFSFDNWKIWDNFMVVSASIKQFFDLVRSYHRILDLKDKHLDIDVLLLLTTQLTLNKEYTNQNTTLLTKTRELFGRLTSIYPNESQLWEMYADLSPNLDLTAQRLNRAYRGLVQDDWAKNPDKCGKVLEICQRLAEVTLEATTANIVASTRLTLRSVISAAKKQAWDQHQEKIIDLENGLENVMNLINK